MAHGKKTGGRKKGTPNRVPADVRAAAQRYTEEAIETLAQIMRSGESDVARCNAADKLLDRGWGKSAQAVTGEGGGPIAIGITWLPSV